MRTHAAAAEQVSNSLLVCTTGPTQGGKEATAAHAGLGLQDHHHDRATRA
jgi:hypothetical protein